MANCSEFWTCPYNPSHQVLATKIQTHLVKCERQHPNSTLRKCKFDPTHRIEKHLMDDHLKTCPSMADLIEFNHQKATPSSSKKENIPELPPADEDESWDDLPPHPTYRPEVKCLNSKIIRTVSGLTPSERKKFKEAERIRLGRME